MSLSFRKPTPAGKVGGGVVEVPKGEVLTIPKTLVTQSIKFVELYGTVASINAGLSYKIINWTIPQGYAAELIAVGIMPDWNVAASASRLLDTEIGYDDKLTGIKFLTNHAGMNALPYGDRLSKRPMRLLGKPMTRGSLTPKYNEGMKIQIVVTAGSVAVADIVRARAQVLLYEQSDCESIFGVGLSKLATVEGGVEQSAPNRLFAEYGRNSAASAGTGQWEDLYTRTVQDYEQIQISHVGIKPHSNSLQAKLYDLRNKKEFPEYDPYFTVLEDANSLPFGDDDDELGPAQLPDVVASWPYINTTFSVKQKDNNAVIPQYGMAVQLIGEYRRLK